MNKDSKIYVAGHRGLVGSALLRYLKNNGYTNLITRSHNELDLVNQKKVAQFFQKEKPDYVFLAAAKVGGIVANNTFPADFIHINLIIQDNVIHQSYLHKVKRLIFLGSSCIYPRLCKQPIKEDYLLTGSLEPTNRPYAVAKIAGIETCWSYNRQYNTQNLAVMPTNLYGPGDNYDLQNSHVLPALIRKMHDAKIKNDKEVIAWGTGKPFREFLYSDDLADACVFLMNLSDDSYRKQINNSSLPLINIGCGKDLSIMKLAELVKNVIGFSGTISWDTSKPDGTPKKQLDISRISSLGWQAKTNLIDGIKKAYSDFLKNHRQFPGT